MFTNISTEQDPIIEHLSIAFQYTLEFLIEAL